MGEVYFVADSHFSHENLITKIKDRTEFSSIEEHDETLIANWNTKVSPGDLVYHLGDFSWGKPELYVDRLAGQIQLIRGNHDKRSTKIYEMYFSWVSGKYQGRMVKTGGHQFFLSHYPMRSWPGKHRGVYHLFGHTHGSVKPLLGSVDVSVDCWNYTPVSVDELIQYFNNQQEHLKNWERNNSPCNNFGCADCSRRDDGM